MARFCEQCGAAQTEGDRFCDKCGHAASGGGKLPVSVLSPSRARGPRSNLSLFLVIGLIAVLLAGGGIAIWQLWPKGISTAVQTPTPSISSPTPSPPPLPTTTVPPNAEGLLYAADFSQPEKEMALGWPNTTEGTDLRVFREGRFIIQREQSGGSTCGPDQEYSDCMVELVAQPMEGGTQCYFGLYWRFLDESNYYEFTVQNGYWQFSKIVNGEWTDLSGWRKNQAIPIGARPSRILVTCQQDRFSFALNDVWLGEFTDASFDHGLIGVIGGASTNERIAVAFDSLRLWENGQGPTLPTPYTQGIGLLFAADFSSPDQVWTEGSFDDGAYQQENGVYRIRVTKPNWAECEPIGDLLRDFTVELEAEAAAGQPSFHYGLYFRRVDKENCYSFTVDNQGRYALYKLEQGIWTPIIDWNRSMAVRTEGGVNRLRVTCQGNRIVLMVNGHLLQEIQNDSFPAGDIAMTVGTWDQTGVEASFRSLQVWSVDAALAMTVEPLQPQLIFSEDFSQPKIEWFDGHANDNPDYYLHLEEGGYFLTIGGRGTWIVNQIGGEFPVDCTAELQASILVGDPNDIFALLVRYQDENNYLGLMVNSAGTYDFLRCVDGELTNLAGPAHSSELRTGTASNRLKVICQGNRFQFFVNDQSLGEVTDDTFPQGQVTFAARRLGTDFLHVRYESIKIWAMP